MRRREKKLIVILSGGGAKTAFQVGAWNRILNKGLSMNGKQTKIAVPNAVFGVSGGAINGAIIAMGKNKELMKFWNFVAGKPNEIYTSDYLKQENGKVVLDTEAIFKYLLSDTNLSQKAGLLFKKSREKVMKKIMGKLSLMQGLASNQPLFEKLQSLVRIEDIKSELFQAGYVSLTDGKYHSIPHFEYSSNLEFQKAVLASSSIPAVWPPVSSIKNKQFELTNLVDGGIRNVTPLGDAVKYVQNQDDNIDYHFLVISCQAPQLKPMTSKPTLLKIVSRGIYDIALDEIRDTDLKEFVRINSLVKQAKQKGIDLYHKNGKKLREFKIKVIQPSRELSFALDFSRTAIMDSFAHGFHQAEKVIYSPNWD